MSCYKRSQMAEYRLWSASSRPQKSVMVTKDQRFMAS